MGKIIFLIKVNKLIYYILLFLFSNDSAVRQFATNKSYSQCWPSDWLPTDVEGLRVIGVDYSTTLTEWLPSCPLKQKR